MRQEPAKTDTPPAEGAPVETIPAGPPPAPPKNILQNNEFYVTVGLLAGVMLLGAIAIKMLAAWRRKQVEPGRWETGIELNNFRELLEAGEITHSEYEKIREKMSTKIKKRVGVHKILPPASASGEGPKIDPEKT